MSKAAKKCDCAHPGEQTEEDAVAGTKLQIEQIKKTERGVIPTLRKYDPYRETLYCRLNWMLLNRGKVLRKQLSKDDYSIVRKTPDIAHEMIHANIEVVKKVHEFQDFLSDRGIPYSSNKEVEDWEPGSD